MTSLLKKLSKELKYRSLPKLFGLTVTIYNFHTVEKDIRRAIGDIFKEEYEIKLQQLKLFSLKLSPEYLPKQFTIADACITNSSFVWFHKYFYM